MYYIQSSLRGNHANDVFSVMASNQPCEIEEIENILICSLCLEVMKSPKTLSCTHSFCEGCLQKNVEIITVDGRKGIHCPFCKTFSEYGEFLNIYHLQELLDLYWKCKKGLIPPCYMCETDENKAIWTCTDCRVNLCEGCQRMHKKLPNCRAHKCIPYNAVTGQAIDVNHFCKSHTDQIMNLYCTQCKKIICLKCKVTNHGNHMSENIGTTITSITQDIKKSLTIVQNHLTELQASNKNLKEKVDNIEIVHSKEVEECETTKLELVSEIERWESETKTVITEAKDQNLKKLQEALEVNERQIKIKDSILKLTNATLTHFKGCSLLMSLTEKIMNRLTQEEKVTHSKVDVTQPQWNKPVVSELPYPVAQMSQPQARLLDVEPFYSKERILDTEILKIMPQIMNVYLDSIDLEDNPSRLCLIGEDIWIGSNCKSSGDFSIIYTSLKIRKYCFLRHDTDVHMFCQTSDDEVIAVCQTGLVVLDIDGKFVSKFSEDHYKDMCTHNGKLFAIESGSRCLDIFAQQNGMWMYLQKISMDYHFSGEDTMITDHTCLYICVKGISKILKYSLEGELINEFGSKGTDPGEFRMPSICGIDKCGNLIVCDAKNHRIQVMVNNYTWLDYSSSEVTFPTDILLYDDFVYILSGRKDKKKLLWENIIL